jgi:hypothetical protein
MAEGNKGDPDSTLSTGRSQAIIGTERQSK